MRPVDRSQEALFSAQSAKCICCSKNWSYLWGSAAFACDVKKHRNLSSWNKSAALASEVSVAATARSPVIVDRSDW
jgi:hypothetical protein